ncbi:unnamed protein product [Closterium sp. NIES-53]
MDAEMASWKSTGTYVDEFPPPGANIVDGTWIFRWSHRRLVYGIRQGPCEWHDTLRTTLAALGLSPSTADPSLFLRTDTSLPPFYVLLYIDDLVFATADTEALTLVKSELQKRHTCTDLGPSTLWLPVLLATAHSSVYQALALSSTFGRVRSDLAYPLSLLACYVAPGRHQKVHWDAAKRVLRYLCSKLGMGLVLEGRGPVVLTGHADASWVDDSATQRSSQGYTFSLGPGSVSWRSTRSSSALSSSCEAEICTGAMAAQELRWLTYLLSDLGEQPRSPPVLYVDNKAMISLCQEHRLEHRTKHIALRYFLALELQQRGLLRLAYVSTRANTADIFTKALPPACFALLLHLTCLVTIACSCYPPLRLSGPLPPLLPSPAPLCLPCVKGRQRAAPHSSSFPPMTAPLQTLHMDVWGPACVSAYGHELYFLLVVDDYTRYTTVFRLRSKGEVVDVLIPWIRAFRLELRERFRQDLPILRLHSDRGGEFSGILQSFTFPDSPQQNGIAEHRIGLVMQVARTSMIHAATPHFLWPFAVRYAAH